MNHTQPILETHKVNNRSISIGSIPSLPIIITASVVFFAVDATIALLRRHKREPVAIAIKEQEPRSPVAHRSLTRFVDKSRSILTDVQALEKQLTISKSRRPRRQTFRRRRHDRYLSTQPSQAHRPEPSCEFSAFCERLLLTNKIWNQEKELKSLRAASAEKTRAGKEAAFNTFCDQLLLWNRIWKLEKEVAEVVREKERIQRERVAAVTRAAKRMVHDVQKERMVEEFVKGLLEEMGTAKAEVGSLQAQHEREMEEIHEDWMKDYRRVTQELAQLKLAQSAKMVEQEVSNSMEESLFESLKEGKRRVECLEESLKAVGYASSEATLNDDASEADFELLSELSTSSTCVSSSGSIRRSSLTAFDPVIGRKRCISQGGTPPATASQRPQHSHSVSVPTTDEGVSATRKNMALAVATRTCHHSGRPLAVRNRTTSVTVASRTPPASPFGTTFVKSEGATGITNRAPWRV
ncbi:hypothetical protein C0991_008345 [Blastosporella zonata]|nr:hypothetical protein C0991_008345 [Blastosporella zonata]